MTARAVATLAPGPGFATVARPALDLAFEGIAGEKHAGFVRRADARVPWHPRGAAIRNVRQVSVVSAEELAEIADALGVAALDPAVFAANLVTAGAPRLSFLPRGTRLGFPSGATLCCEGYNPPCIVTGKAIAAAIPGVDPKAFVKAAARRRGIVASVERPGAIAAGETIAIVTPEQWLYRP